MTDIPKRLPGWERAYADTISRLAATPFSWRENCLTRVADVCEAMTGVNPFPRDLRTFTTKTAALRALNERGFGSEEDALAAFFPPIPLAMARRGDCAIGMVRVKGETPTSTFIVMGSKALGANESGVVVVDALMLKKAFRIG